MIIDIVTLIPQVFDKVFDESILGAAKKSGLIDVRLRNFRELGEGRHKTVDDSPFGGGPGMVIKPGPLTNYVRMLRTETPVGPVIGLTPQGIPLKQKTVKELARFDRLILVCGRYEGFDDRLLNEFDMELSIGDFVISGGEFAAMAVVDAVARMIPGTVGRMESVIQDSFFDGALDHPQFTRPSTWEGRPVPAILLQGGHKDIDAWRRRQSLVRTAIRRPDLFSQQFIDEDRDRSEVQTAIEEYPVV